MQVCTWMWIVNRCSGCGCARYCEVWYCGLGVVNTVSQFLHTSCWSMTGDLAANCFVWILAMLWALHHSGSNGKILSKQFPSKSQTASKSYKWYAINFGEASGHGDKNVWLIHCEAYVQSILRSGLFFSVSDKIKISCLYNVWRQLWQSSLISSTLKTLLPTLIT